MEFMLLHALYHRGLVIQKEAQELKTLKKSLSQPLCMISTTVIVQPHPRYSHMLERCSSSFELPLCETWLSLKEEDWFKQLAFALFPPLP